MKNQRRSPGKNQQPRGRKPAQNQKSEGKPKFFKKTDEEGKPKFFKKTDEEGKPKFFRKKEDDGKKKWYPKKREQKILDQQEKDKLGVRLNKFLANAGVCSRREADMLIESGIVEINGKVVTALGTKVLPTDEVKYDGQTLRREKKVYLLMNKPKGYITTSKDENNRKTVLDLVRPVCKERIYPVGRLDRDTTGVLLFTNDGELAKKLTHPSHGVKKIYHVNLDKNVKKVDLEKLCKGITLEDGVVNADVAVHVGDGLNKKEVGVELHSGKYRVIRRMFEKLGYKVVKLDRVSFAGLTKKKLSRGETRMLTEEEITFLKRVK